MTKQSGLGDNFYVGGYDVSGDISAIGTVSASLETKDTTGIDKSAHERIHLTKDGSLEWTTHFNPATGQAHKVISAMPRTDVQICYFRGTAIGNPAACLLGKQLNYSITRAADGGLNASASARGNGYGLEWGDQLTAGKRTDTAATNGTGLDTTASASFGGQAYLQVFAFSGTDVTVKIQDSADNVTFADVTSFAFAAISSGTPQAQRLQLGATATIRRYVRAVTTTSGGVTSVTFSVVLVKNTSAVTF